MDSSYRQEPLEGGRVRFTVTPATVPGASGAPLVLAIITGFIVIATTPGRNGMLVLIWFGLAIAAAWQVYKLTNRWFASRVDKIRSPGGTFVISPDAIESGGGAAISREQLHRLILRNGVPDVGEAIVVNTGTVYSGMQAGAQNDRMANRAKAANISWMLCAESGGRSTTLAGGMTEVTAHGLLTDVSRILRLA